MSVFIVLGLTVRGVVIGDRLNGTTIDGFGVTIDALVVADVRVGMTRKFIVGVSVTVPAMGTFVEVITLPVNGDNWLGASIEMITGGKAVVRTVVGSFVTDKVLPVGCDIGTFAGANPSGILTAGAVVETISETVGTLIWLGPCTPFDAGRLIELVGAGEYVDGLRVGSLLGDTVGSSFANDTPLLVVGAPVSLVGIKGNGSLSEKSFQAFRTDGFFIKSEKRFFMLSLP